jgi:thioredoxin 1
MLIGYELLEEYVGVIMGQVLEVNDADFDMVTKGNEWVLVDFWAPWCGPCKMIAPILKEIAGERDITIAKVNTDVNSLSPGKYNVRGIPNLILFHNGEPVEQITGAMPKPGMDNWLNRHMI